MSVQSSGKSESILYLKIDYQLRPCSYSQHNITEAEMQSLDTRVQEAVKRTAQNNLMRQGQHPAWGAGGGYYPAAAPAGGVQLKRYGEYERFLLHDQCSGMAQTGCEIARCSIVSSRQGKTTIFRIDWGSPPPTSSCWSS